MQYKRFQHLVRKNFNGMFSSGIVLEAEQGRVVVEVKDGREIFSPQHENNWMDWSTLCEQMEAESHV